MSDNNIWLEYIKNIKKIQNYKKRVITSARTIQNNKSNSIINNLVPSIPRHPWQGAVGTADRGSQEFSLLRSPISDSVFVRDDARVNTSSRIDLHGLTQDQAFETLKTFLHNAFTNNKQELLIITGKGKPDKPGVIKLAVPRWLQYTELNQYILSYNIAKDKLGGEGAISVTLKRKKGDLKYE